MIVFESHRQRRLLARLSAGESLVATLERLAREKGVTSGWVQAVGVVANADLATYDGSVGRRRSPRRVNGPLELVSLSGSIASFGGELRAEVHAQLSRESDRGLEMLGGHLVDAEVIAVDVILDSFDDLGVRRELDGATGLPTFRPESRANVLESRGREPASRAERTEAPRSAEPARSLLERVEARAGLRDEAPRRTEEKPQPTKAPGVSWAMAAAVSDSSVASSEPAFADPIRDAPKSTDEEEYQPKPGDWVDHRQFGMCRVDRAGDDGELLIKLETGRRKAIRLDFLEVLPPRMEGNRRVYPLRPKKR